MFTYLILGLAIYTILSSEVTSVSFLFSALILMLYIVPYFTLWDTFTKLHIVSEKAGADFFSFIFFCYLAFIAGTLIAGNAHPEQVKAKTFENSFVQKKYELCCFVIGLIGIAGYGYFVTSSGGDYFLGHQSGNFSVGGYVYELRYFIFSSFLLLFQSYLKKTLSRNGKIFLLSIFILLALDAYFQQQRGSWIRFGVIILLSYVFNDTTLPKVRLTTLLAKNKKIFVLGIFFAFLLTFTLQIRRFYSPNTSFAEQVSSTINYMFNKPDVLVGGSGIEEGNEFVTAYNAYRSNTVAKTYDYGYKWLYGFINFIPRKLWKNKPTWFTFSNDVFATMDKYLIFGHTNGSAETGIIDAFYRFLYFAPAFFILFGFYTQRLHQKAKANFNVRMFYICFFIGSFYFITQNMFPLIIFTLYMYIPVVFVLKFSSRKGGYVHEEA